MRRAYAIGMVAGWALWIVLVAITYALEEYKQNLPRWIIDADLPDTIGTAFGIAAYPVTLGGWLIWGDGPQPPSWVKSMSFNAIVCLVFYGTLGAMAGAICARLRKRNKTVPVPE